MLLEKALDDKLFNSYLDTYNFIPALLLLNFSDRPEFINLLLQEDKSYKDLILSQLNKFNKRMTNDDFIFETYQSLKVTNEGFVVMIDTIIGIIHDTFTHTSRLKDGEFVIEYLPPCSLSGVYDIRVILDIEEEDEGVLGTQTLKIYLQDNTESMIISDGYEVNIAKPTSYTKEGFVVNKSQFKEEAAELLNELFDSLIACVKEYFSKDN